MATRYIVIDDDRESIDVLVHLLDAYPEFRMVGKAYNGCEGKSVVLEERPNLLFCDIDLPDKNGIDFWNELSLYVTWSMEVVFYTAYDQYMLNALRSTAIDYLMKPLDEADVDAFVTRYREKLKNENGVGCLTRMTDSEVSKVFSIRTVRNEIQLLRLQNIGYFSYNSKRKGWSVVLDNHAVLALKKGTTKETILGYSTHFMQIHPSYIINMDYLMMISDNICKLYPPFESVSELVISRAHLKEITDKLLGI